MAKTFQEIVQTELGGLHMQLLALASQLEVSRDENAALKAEILELKAVRFPDKKPEGK
jgi:hypothetical protein